MSIALVPVWQVDQIWPHVAEGLQRAIDKGSAGDVTLGELWTECRSGRAFLLYDDQGGASVWIPRQWAGGTVLFCLAMYSGRKDWLDDLLNVVWSLADQCGATALQASSKRPWLAKLTGRNVRQVTALYEMRK